MNTKEGQVLNPYMPTYEYVPDGEPHVFNERVYVYGSHDRYNGAHFCLNDYICYSADVTDLTKWKYEGVIYRKEQDPRNQNIPLDAPLAEPGFGVEPADENALNGPGIHAMYAPDVVRGLDGRYYLYYCLDCLPEIAVAVCDTPAGQYEYLGMVRHKDGRILGQAETDLIQFDPGIFIDDDQTIYLYSGNAPIRAEFKGERQGSQVMTLEPDMLTLKTEPKKLLVNIHESEGTGFEGHEFFEASSIRKVGKRYYFVYSSIQSHELCYAVSDRPDGDYKYGGTLVDIGDIFFEGRTAKETLNALGNTHGGIEQINGRWYVFYHRQTNRTNFSRQACAEEIFFSPDGSIAQVQVTSCGLNGGPLRGNGRYPACCCCRLTGKNGATFSHPQAMKMNYPYLTQDKGDMEPDEPYETRERERPVQYIANILDGTIIGYKYFDFKAVKAMSLELRGQGHGEFLVYTDLEGEPVGKIGCDLENDMTGGGEKTSIHWQDVPGHVFVPDGVSPLYFKYMGTGALELRSFEITAG